MGSSRIVGLRSWQVVLVLLTALASVANGQPIQYFAPQKEANDVVTAHELLLLVYARIDLSRSVFLADKRKCVNNVRYGAPPIDTMVNLAERRIPELVSALDACHVKIYGKGMNRDEMAAMRKKEFKGADVLERLMSVPRAPTVPKNQSDVGSCGLYEEWMTSDLQNMQALIGYPKAGWCETWTASMKR